MDSVALSRYSVGRSVDCGRRINKKCLSIKNVNSIAVLICIAQKLRSKKWWNVVCGRPHLFNAIFCWSRVTSSEPSRCGLHTHSFFSKKSVKFEKQSGKCNQLLKKLASQWISKLKAEIADIRSFVYCLKCFSFIISRLRSLKIRKDKKKIQPNNNQ